MLKTLRDKAQNWVAKILLGLLILSFATWGIESWISGWAFRNPPAEVGNIYITTQELKGQVERQFQQMRAMFGKTGLDDETRQGIIQNTIDRLINEKLIQLTIQDMGIPVSDEQMKRKIQEDPAFKGKDGKFSKPNFESFLMEHNLSEADFITAWKMNIQKQTLIDTLFHEISPPHILAQASFNQKFSKRIVDLITIPYDKIVLSEKPTSEQLQALYQKLQKDFMTPETRDISIISLLPKNEATEELYKRSTNLEDLLAAGKLFEEAARLVDGQYIHLASLKKFPNTNLNMAQIEKLFSLKAGEETALEELSSGGYQIMKVDRISPAAPQSFEAVKDKVRASWEKEAQKSRAAAIAQTIEKSIQEKQNPDAVPAESKVQTDLAISQVSDTVSPAIREATFNLQVGATKALEEPEGMTIIHLKSIQKPTANQPMLQKYEADFSKDFNENFLNQFFVFEKNKQSVTVHQDVIDRLFKKSDDE